MTGEEMLQALNLVLTKGDTVSRAALADALEERGMTKAAHALRTGRERATFKIESPRLHQKYVKVQIRKIAGHIRIRVDGYGMNDPDRDHLVSIGYFSGPDQGLAVCVWSENKNEHSHLISLEGTKKNDHHP